MNTTMESLMRRQNGVFSAAQAVDLGVDGDELSRAQRRGEVHQLRRGIYTCDHYIRDGNLQELHLIEAAGALLARDGLLPEDRDWTRVARAVGHRSAALIWGLPAPMPPEPATSVRKPGSRPRPRSSRGLGRYCVELIAASRSTRAYEYGVHTRPAGLPAEHVTAMGAVPITTLARTCVDVARECSWEEAVVLCDAVLRRGVQRSELQATLASFPRWPGSRQAGRAVEFADPRAESPAESLARAVLSMLGLPEPELQVDIYDEDGLIGRVDLLFRAQRVIVEIDGKIKYTRPYGNPGEVIWKEKRREDRLREAGWEVVRITWEQLTGDPNRLRARLLAAFARGAARAS